MIQDWTAMTLRSGDQNFLERLGFECFYFEISPPVSF